MTTASTSRIVPAPGIPAKAERVMNMPLDEAYFVWLYSQVGSVDNKNRSKTYWNLLRIFYGKEFTWLQKIERDENRAQDGRDLRREFLQETKTKTNDRGWLEMPCSFLELLVALAWRLEFQSGEESQSTWFWILIDNLGLTECTDTHPPDEIIVNHILDKVMNRDYAKNGAGGLFPLKRATEDQRDVELWYQAEAYLLERL